MRGLQRVWRQTYDADLEIVAGTAKKRLLFLSGLFWGHSLLCETGC